MSNETSHHDLASEFPELKDKIHELKISNAHFRNLFEKYQTVDKGIARAEARIDLLSNEQEENLRKERLKLKDELYVMLTSQN